MHIVVVGHGWIAGKMMHALRHYQPVQKSHDTILYYLNDRRDHKEPIAWVVNCAGYTGIPNVDACERLRSETIRANTVFPIVLQAAVEKYGARLLHFSSGCIFQGGPFHAADTPNFDGSVYSASKMVSDMALRDRAIVARIRMPFDSSSHPKNLLVKLAYYAKNSSVLDGLNSLSNADEACEVCVELIEENAPNGPYNLVNSGTIWTRQIMSMMSLQPDYWPKGEFNRIFPAIRSECMLVPSVAMTPVEDSLKVCLVQMKEAA